MDVDSTTATTFLNLPDNSSAIWYFQNTKNCIRGILCDKYYLPKIKMFSKSIFTFLSTGNFLYCREDLKNNWQAIVVRSDGILGLESMLSSILTMNLLKTASFASMTLSGTWMLP